MRLKFKNQDEKQEWIEVFVGGACGLIAIIAAIVEFCLGDNGAIAGTIKDIFGTAVVVVLLVTAMPKRKPKNLSGLLEQAVEEWGLNNAPFIFKAEEYVQAQNSLNTQCFLLLQDPQKDYIDLVNKSMNKESPDWIRYAKDSKYNHLTGKFLDMPNYEDMVKDNFELLLCLEQTHFKKMENIDSIINDLSTAINVHSSEKISAGRIGKSQTIRLTCKPISSIQDIKEFVETLDFILSLIKVVA